jgi:threonine dehydrogenase-like Zn-dependent dehydrogenase
VVNNENKRKEVNGIRESQKMQAVVFDGTVKFIDNHPVPVPNETEALIRVSMAGICNTDMEITRGYLGFHGVMGHEFVGIVEGAPAYAAGFVGTRIVGEINCGCGVCSYCMGGLQRHCPSRATLGIRGKDGVFAEYVTLPVSNLHVIPDTVSDEEAVFIEPLAAAYEISEQIKIEPTQAILVLGDGKLGLLCALVLSLTGAEIALAGKHDRKLNIAGDRHIQTINVTGENLGEEKKYDIVVEATGSAEGLMTALGHVKPRGTIVLKSTIASSQHINLAPVVIDEITVIGSRCGPFEPAIQALAERRINVRPLISGIYPMREAQKAFGEARKKENLKIIIDLR